MNEQFKQEVIRALEKRELTEVRYIGRARGRRCPNDNVRLYKFRGFKNESAWVAYACEKCRHVHMKSLVFLKPILVEL